MSDVSFRWAVPAFVVLGVSFLILELVTRRLGWLTPAQDLLWNPFSISGLAGSLICHRRYASFRSRGASGNAMLGLIALICLALGVARHMSAGFDLFLFVEIAGVYGLALMTADVLVSDGSRGAAAGRLAAAVLLPIGASLVPTSLTAAAGTNPIYDATVASLDRHLGLTTAIQHSYAILPPVSAVATGAYLTLPLALAAVAFQQSPARVGRLLAAIGVVGALGYILFFLCPVIGPAAAVADGLRLDGLPGPLTAPPDWRNGMPSLHTAWALLILFNVFNGTRSRLIAWVLVGFASLNIWATIGLGQHWLTDLVVSVPFAVAVQIGVIDDVRRVDRQFAVAVCACLIGSWLVLIRSTTIAVVVPSGVVWLLVLATLGSLVLRVRAVSARMVRA